MTTYTVQLSDRLTSDVLVVGSGSAGAVAAIAAARQGASVTLVERYGFMGGISTQVLDTFYGFYIPGTKATKVVGGIPDEVARSLLDNGHALLRPNTYGAGQGITYNPEMLKVVWEDMAVGAGVRLLLHTLVVDTIVNGDVLRGVIAATKHGIISIEAPVIIDASGDADVAASSGVPFESARDQPVQSLTTTFRLANVDTDRAVGKQRLHELMGEAAAEYDLPRREGSVHITPLAGVMATNLTRVAGVDPTDPVELSRAEVEGRRQAVEYTRFLRDRVRGYESADIVALSTQIGVRESRRVFGEYRLTRDDVLAARDFDDAIARCGAPIEEHHSGGDTRWEYLPDGATYGIPYRCIVPRDVDGLLVAGRCLSADHDAHASVRSMGQCMAVGQAAGIAAALAVAGRTSPRDVPVPVLQQQLREIGAVV